MRILVTPTFVRAVKKLHPPQKAALDEAVRRVAGQPSIGDAKAGDLVGVQVYKFHMGQLLCLLAYRMLDGDTIKLLMVGPHENFYRDLKRSDHQ
jgi:mRNA-degrading endonuclease RelE of RelBE toxin-antitoxin system